MYNTDLPNRIELPSSKQLLRSTIIAMITAVVVLVTVVLPSEYGIDPTGIGRLLGLTQMGNIKMKLAVEAAKHNAAPASVPGQQANASPLARPSEALDATTSTARPNASPQTAQRIDETIVTLKSGEGVEVKMEMLNGAKAKYEWTSTGGPVNHDLHTDTPDSSHSYSKGQGVDRDSGEFTAVSDGFHGWFWRNRNNNDVIIKLRTTGDYRSIKRM